MITSTTPTGPAVRSLRLTRLALAGAATAALVLSAGGVAAAGVPGGSDPSAPAASGTARTDISFPRVAREWAAAWNAATPARMASLFTAEGVYEDFAFGATFTGREQVAGWVTTTNAAIDDVHVEVTDAFRAGDRVSVRWTFSGHIVGAPTAFSVPATTVMELERGRIAYNADYYNLAEVLRDSGLPAERPAADPAG